MKDAKLIEMVGVGALVLGFFELIRLSTCFIIYCCCGAKKVESDEDDLEKTDIIQEAVTKEVMLPEKE